MKGITIKSLIIIVAASLELSSCNVLDINDTSSLSDQAIWSSETAADMYVTASYKTFTTSHKWVIVAKYFMIVIQI